MAMCHASQANCEGPCGVDPRAAATWCAEAQGPGATPLIHATARQCWGDDCWNGGYWAVWSLDANGDRDAVIAERDDAIQARDELGSQRETITEQRDAVIVELLKVEPPIPARLHTHCRVTTY